MFLKVFAFRRFIQIGRDRSYLRDAIVNVKAIQDYAECSIELR